MHALLRTHIPADRRRAPTREPCFLAAELAQLAAVPHREQGALLLDLEWALKAAEHEGGPWLEEFVGKGGVGFLFAMASKWTTYWRNRLDHQVRPSHLFSSVLI